MELLPAKEIAKAYSHVLLNSNYLEYENDPLNQHPLSYGTDPGNYDTRSVITKWQDKKFGLPTPTDPNTLNLTGGASYGVANILASATDSSSITKQAFIVSPTYYLINSSFLDVGFKGKLTAIDETPDHGEYDIDIEFLEEQLKKHSEGLEVSTADNEINIDKGTNRGERKYYRFVIYLVPTFSNPGGQVYTVETRLKLLELARQYDMLIISDDVYEFLDYTGAEYPTPRFVHLDKQSLNPVKTFGNSISNATSSKLIAPGLRFGWQETATCKLSKQLSLTGPNKSGGTPGQLASSVFQYLVESGKADEIISTFKVEYSKRAKTMLAALEKYLPPKHTQVYGGNGGYFLWVVIGKGDPLVKLGDIVKKLQVEHGVILASGASFEVEGDSRDWGHYAVRLCVSYLTAPEIETGIEIFGSELKREYPHLYQ